MLKEFNYANINQRKFIYLNSFFTFASIALLFADISLREINSFFYFTPLRLFFISLILGLFTGNLTGRFFFRLMGNSRPLYAAADILFILTAAAYMLRGYIFPGPLDPLYHSFNLFPYLPLLILFFPAFFAGIKTNYFLKISCGNFIDEKQGIFPYIIFSISGILTGSALAAVRFIFTDPGSWEQFSAIYVVMPAFIAITIFFINLPYSPKSQFMQHFTEGDESPVEKAASRDTLIFTYLNFSYVILYLYFSLETVIKAYGDIPSLKVLFVSLSFLGIMAGFICGRFIKNRLFHIYTELIFPVLIFPCIYLLNIHLDRIPFHTAVLISAPALIFFGITVYHTVTNIMAHYDHQNRYSIINISLFILPVPVISALSFISFNYFLFFSVLYFFGFMNILLPGITILNIPIKGYKKVLYFLFSLIIIVTVIFCHHYYKIPFSTEIYASRTRNFDELKKTNFNAPFIKNRAAIFLNGAKVFSLSDSHIRNLKKSLIPLSVFVRQDKNHPILFIDGNHKFYRNPVIGYYPNSLCLDPLPAEAVDFNRIPISGSQSYIAENRPLLDFLRQPRNKFSAIVDIPNLYDQGYSSFRFSHGFYRIMSGKLNRGGIFSQAYNISEIRSEFLAAAINNHKTFFKKSVTFLFSNILVIMSSQDPDAFSLTDKKYARLTELFNGHDDLGLLLYNEYNVMAHLISSEIDPVAALLPKAEIDPCFFLTKPLAPVLEESFYRDYAENNAKPSKLIETNAGNAAFMNSFAAGLSLHNPVYTLMKKTELAESGDSYENETKHLFELKNYTDTRPDLKKYLNNILLYKEEYYYNAGIRLENDKRWEEAMSLYKASLTINPNNFNTNYRLGLLCIILQDIDNAFMYFNHAMAIDKNHPKVFYQIGVLLFSRGRIDEAMSYFNKALDLKENTSSIYLYLGLSYEKLNNMTEAEGYYTKALLLDPNDDNIKSRIENIRKKRDEERNRWKTEPLRNETEAEQGEKIPLPINKSALEFRLTDKEAEKIRNYDDTPTDKDK